MDSYIQMVKKIYLNKKIINTAIKMTKITVTYGDLVCLSIVVTVDCGIVDCLMIICWV